jgi:hypothetical protein
MAVMILALVLLLGWLTKVTIEDPFRRGRLLAARPPRWTFASAAAATAIVVAVTVGASAHLSEQVRAAVRASERALAEKPHCFGAAARDPRASCTNRRLRLAVIPTPLVAASRPNAPCRTLSGRGLIRECTFGLLRRRATSVVALIGDSHASHLRAALEVVARRKGWHGISIARSGCPLTGATKNLRRPADRADCQRWSREVLAWLAAHPEVRTVVVSQISGSSWVPRAGRSQFATAVEGFTAAWKAVPRSVERIVVVRDTPKAETGTADCVQRAIDRRRPAGRACAIARGRALVPDPAAVAAARLRSPRVGVADLSQFICDRRLCYPVVGGALVYKDQHHLTTVFATTLGPYLQREVENLTG